MHVEKRWQVPSTLPVGLRSADGAGVLEEDLAGLGILLWDLAREVVRWGEAEPSSDVPRRDEVWVRAKLASLLTMVPDQETPLPALMEIAELPDRPTPPTRLRIALTARQLSSWAEGRGALATAAAFAQAAVALCPTNAGFAYALGRLLRRRADYPRAEEWLRRAVVSGRRVHDWRTCTDALGGLGNLHIQRGNYPRAERYHRRALGVARRQGLRDLEGQALLSLCGIAIEGGRLSDTNRYARAAYEAFGQNHVRLPVLAHDVAYAWMEHGGYFASALCVFEAVLPYTEGNERATVLADICRAAAGCGETERFERGWIEARDYIDSVINEEHLAQAQLDLARAASSIGCWERAEEAAQRSLDLATARSEARVRLAAEAVLEAITSERAVDIHQPPVDEVETSTEVKDLAVDFVLSLGGCALVGV